jgi:hypothetical protein
MVTERSSKDIAKAKLAKLMVKHFTPEGRKERRGSVARSGIRIDLLHGEGKRDGLLFFPKEAAERYIEKQKILGLTSC